MFQHIPVLLNEVIEYLNPQSNQNFVDATLGGGGHAIAILKKTAPAGKLLGIDLDRESLKIAEENIKSKILNHKERLILVEDNFKNLKKIIDEHKFNKIFGILLDLGLSSIQLQSSFRGFSFQINGPLDMRFGKNTDLNAFEIINSWPQNKLIEIFKNFGQERLAEPISKEIFQIRQRQKITSTLELAEIIRKIYKKYYKKKSKINSATKIFQALRIAVNQELENLKEFLPQAIDVLDKKGRLAIISYHSLEDKIVKDFFKREAKDCLCPPQFPKCQCNHKRILEIKTKKPILPTLKEQSSNPRSRSAKLRVAEKIYPSAGSGQLILNE